MERKTALVTGGSRGIGRAICIRLAKEGFDIAFNYQSGKEAALETQRLCEEEGARCLMVQADITNSKECDELISSTVEWSQGKLDVLVNNAGITKDNLLMKISDEDLDAVLNVNLKGSFYMMRGVSRIMLRNRTGRIINMSSVVGLLGNAGQVNYSASKAAVIGMTKSLARELASRKITVNAVAPGMIETDMTDAIPEAMHEAMLNQIPLKRIGTPEDIANGVLFLASDEASYITGQVITIDGGLMG